MKRCLAIALCTLTLLMCSCADESIQLDYAESFTVSAFNEINKNHGSTLEAAKYCYISPHQLALPDETFTGCTERQRYYFSQLYCCTVLTVIKDGQSSQYTRYFSISGYDFTEELKDTYAIKTLYASLSFTSLDLSRLTRFLSR